MRRVHRLRHLFVIACGLLAIRVVGSRMGMAGIDAANGETNESLPSVSFRQAPLVQMPGVEDRRDGYYHVVDSNSPAHWDGDTFYLFNSFEHPWRSSGPDLFHLGKPVSVHLGEVDDRLSIWIESTWKDDDGTLFGTYHYEPDAVCVSNNHLPTVPKMGWIRSPDNGEHWEDLGFILAADPGAVRCGTQSPWDAGGYGSVVAFLDQKKEYFYFFGESYDAHFEEQGIWTARMAYADRINPSGKVLKWHKGRWSEPGIGGHITPIFPAETDFHQKGGGIMFWGPVVHWNTHLGMYVMTLNHIVDPAMTQDGVYITYNRDLSDPKEWTTPLKIIDRKKIQEATAGAMLHPVIRDNGWYAEVIGTGKGETDKLVGRSGRFFMAGLSRLEALRSRTCCKRVKF